MHRDWPSLPFIEVAQKLKLTQNVFKPIDDTVQLRRLINNQLLGDSRAVSIIERTKEDLITCTKQILAKKMTNVTQADLLPNDRAEDASDD